MGKPLGRLSGSERVKPEEYAMGKREWSRREAVRHRCVKAQAQSENWGGRVNQFSNGRLTVSDPCFFVGPVYSAAAPKKMRLTLPLVKLKMMPP
jgi:hypothetical protein